MLLWGRSRIALQHGKSSILFGVNLAALLMVLLAAPQFRVEGEIVSSSKESFRRAQIESIDRRFIESTDIGFDGKFAFKKIPEGLYKLTLIGDERRQEQRTIEVRPAFADGRGRVVIKIELAAVRIPRDEFKVGVAALAISPKAMDELRRAYDARGDVEKARAHLQKAIDISPNFDEALNNLGTIYYHEKQFAKAAELFERALRANPNSFPAQVNLGGALISLGNYEWALAENLKAITMRPADSLAQSQTGEAFFHLHRYDEALAHLEAAKRIDPASFTLPGLFIAEIHALKGDVPGAIGEYQEFLKTHPGHPEAQTVELQLQRLERARQ
jgi:tetratricopeptide (TPR) repeat protein